MGSFKSYICESAVMNMMIMRELGGGMQKSIMRYWKA